MIILIEEMVVIMNVLINAQGLGNMLQYQVFVISKFNVRMRNVFLNEEEGKEWIEEKPYQCLHIESTPKCGERSESCFNSYNCKLSEPFRCANCEYKRYPYIPDGVSLYSCDISIVCPDCKPFLCADGSCVEKTTFCKSINSLMKVINLFALKELVNNQCKYE